MAQVQLNFLGDLEVIRDGETMRLPPSKKTRALLAYLVLNQRSFRREQLCELLWEIPDDPRGSLRWSLSKLRRLVDDDAHPRIIADRTSVGFDATDLTIDVTELHTLVNNGLYHASLEALEDAASRYRGNLLEGLELSNFHEFHAWCIGEREVAARAQAGVLHTLIDRLARPSEALQQQERALPFARDLVAISPYDEAARATLIRLLVRLHRAEEAEQQYLLGIRMLEEVAAEPTGLLFAAWRGNPGNIDRPPAGEASKPERSTGFVSVSSSTGPTGTGRLIGRDVEFERLRTALSSVVHEGIARIMFVQGEPGIGKSRLLESVTALARDADAFILQASAFESEVKRPFALWIDAFRKQDSGAADIFAGDDHDNRDRLFGALSDLIARESNHRPVVLMFDDLQWCDESSAAALHYVARMNRERPLLAVLAARDDELRDNAAVQQALRGLRHDDLLGELKLGPLSAEDVRELIEARAPDADSVRLSQECRGNPLLAVELARAETAGDSGSSLDELVAERLSRFDVDGGEVLRWAAVLSPRIDVAALVRVTGMDSNRIGEVLEIAERQAMLQSTDRGFRFSHDLIARGVHASISPARRRVMHHRVAEHLEQDTATDLEYAADLAHHSLQSGDPGLATRAMVSASRLCLRFFANDDALALARKGLQLAAQLSGAERVCIKLDLSDIMLRAAPIKDWEAAAAEYVSLAEEALDHGALSHARLGYHMASYVRWVHGNWAGAREETLQAERVTRSGSDEEHIIGMAETAKCLAMLERDLTQADAMLMEAQALSVRHRVSHHAIPAGLGMLRYHENKLDDAEELLKEARTLCKTAGDRVNEFQANEYLVMIDFERKRYAEALARCSTLVEIGQKLREGSEAPFARALEGLCRYAIDDETAQLDTALAELRVVDAKHRLAYTLTRAALLDVERGRMSDALSRANEALEYAEVLERATEKLLAHVVLALTKQSAGDGSERARHLAAIAEIEQAPVARWARDQARELIAEGG